MTALLGVLAVVALPLGALLALLKAVDLVEHRRAAVVARQIEVTDAIHREFGPIVAPTVRRARGGWRVVLPMYAGHPATARVVELAALTFGPDVTVEVAVVAPYTARPRLRPPAAQNKERMAATMSA
jgi:hypothetical protein